MDQAIATNIIERAILEELEAFKEELTTGQRKLIADCAAREALRRLCRDYDIAQAVKPANPK